MNKNKAGNISHGFKQWLSSLLNNRKLIVFAIFLIVAALLWFFNALDQTYVTTVNLSIRFKNLPEQKALKNDLLTEINLSVSGYGYHLLQLKVQKNRIPVVIDLKNYQLNKVSNNQDIYYITTNQFSGSLESRFNKEISLLDINPDTVYFDYSNIISRKVPVIANIGYNFDNRFMATDKLKVEPDSIIISGAKNIIENTDFVKTKYHNFGTVQGIVSKTVDLKLNDNIESNNKSVDISIFSEKFSEKLVSSTIEVTNLPADKSITLIPQNVDIIFRVPVSKYSEITNADFTVVADFMSAANGKIKLSLKDTLNDISEVRLNPSEVRYIIEEIK
ncbi:MAG TPA: hypothetical protein PLO05_09630 [Bacteroidales bacterium]|nr:hypothetical protein [Bacteroidales bacterium]MDD4236377.1 hypothetical protein [Bacteroidales bacterium]HXK82406.1 hypothetical protein [Bacteroidales bacterium]